MLLKMHTPKSRKPWLGSKAGSMSEDSSGSSSGGHISPLPPPV